MNEPCTCSRPQEDYGLPSCPREDECFDAWAERESYLRAGLADAYGFTEEEVLAYLGPEYRAACAAMAGNDQ